MHKKHLLRTAPSHGQINIFNLAWNAGTSVNQIERFCARNLPLSRNVQPPRYGPLRCRVSETGGRMLSA